MWFKKKKKKATREDTTLIISVIKISCENFKKYQEFNPVLISVIINRSSTNTLITDHRQQQKLY